MNHELAERFSKWAEQYIVKTCPDGCLPLPAQEVEISLFAEVVRELHGLNNNGDQE